MILLDTNVISEMMKTTPSSKVIAWIDEQEITHLFVSTITIAEISYGLSALPEGNRRQLLEHAFNNTIKEAFKHRVISFDEPAAHQYGKMMSSRKKLGRPLNILDGQIAAIALEQRFALATRNTRDFINCEIDLIDPFK
ncbi:MAG: type II toxin-antitoxin system VapC family toxin [Gammaproteobacteria bacterium]